MIRGEPSHTAYRVALRRAAHQLLDHPLVLVDPLAVSVLRSEDAAALREEPHRFERGPLAPYLRAFMAVRSRVAEDRLADARARGVRQYVVLGAGLDTSPYRLPARDSPVRSWEVDHPATQAWKRERLAEGQITVPAGHHFVGVDFERDDLGLALTAAGFDAGAGAVFSWLGVTPYLTHDAIRATLGYIARAVAGGGGVTFDYALEPSSLGLSQRVVYEALAARVRAAGEPWLSAFVPGELAAELRTLGFASACDLAPDQLNERYFAGRADGLKVGGLAHLMWAGT